MSMDFIKWNAWSCLIMLSYYLEDAVRFHGQLGQGDQSPVDQSNIINCFIEKTRSAKWASREPKKPTVIGELSQMIQIERAVIPITNVHSFQGQYIETVYIIHYK